MSQINLLPTTDQGSAKFNKSVDSLKKVLIAAVSFFFISGVIVGGYIFFLSRSINAQQRKVTELENNIEALQQSESRLILIQNKLAQLEDIESEGYKNDIVLKLRQYYLDHNFQIAEANISRNNNEVKFRASDSSQLVELMSSLTSFTGFEEVILTSLTLEDGSYLVTVNLL